MASCAGRPRARRPAGPSPASPTASARFSAWSRGGLSDAGIAAEPVVSEATVTTHVACILMKLGLRDRIQAAVLADESGFARPGMD